MIDIFKRGEKDYLRRSCDNAREAWALEAERADQAEEIALQLAVVVREFLHGDIEVATVTGEQVLADFEANLEALRANLQEATP